jgi:hypothetical protein
VAATHFFDHDFHGHNPRSNLVNLNLSTAQPLVRIMVPAGALGTGIQKRHVREGLALGAQAMALDAGSTDSGPYYLATGRSKYSRDAVKSDLRVLMQAQAEAGIPLLIGSCGTSGADAGVDWTRGLVEELAAELGLSPKIACLYSEVEPVEMAARAGRNEILCLPPMADAAPERFTECDRIVALMGPEPYIAALQSGADIVLGGRTTDTAVIAAFALLNGCGAGPAWHGAKTTECGGLCTVQPRSGGVVLEVGADHFTVSPLDPTNRCTPYSVSAHMLYENSDPFRLIEPGGVLDVSAARYEALDERSVRVTGSCFEPAPYTMKLEGAAGGGFQTVMLIGIRDPKVLSQMDLFIARMQEALEMRVNQAMGLEQSEFDISLRAYGWNALDGAAVKQDGQPPREVGLMFIATAANQDLATEIARTCNPWFFHMPLNLEQELPSYAFPFSPAEIERGQCHEFKLNHAVQTADAMELVRMATWNIEALNHG